MYRKKEAYEMDLDEQRTVDAFVDLPSVYVTTSTAATCTPAVNKYTKDNNNKKFIKLSFVFKCYTVSISDYCIHVQAGSR